MEWRPVVGFEGFLEVSPSGIIRTVEREVSRPTKGKYVVKSIIIKQRHDQRGYLRIHANYNGKDVALLVHRAVAMAFIPNTDNKPQVDHIDGNKNNNNVSNLRWVTNRENFDYSVASGLRVKSFEALREYGNRSDVRLKNIKATKEKNSKKTYCYDTNYNLVKVYDSATEAATELGCNVSVISQKCRNGNGKFRDYVLSYTPIK